MTETNDGGPAFCEWVNAKERLPPEPIDCTGKPYAVIDIDGDYHIARFIGGGHWFSDDTDPRLIYVDFWMALPPDPAMLAERERAGGEG